MSRAGVAALALALATGCAPGPHGGAGKPDATDDVEQGLASFYADSLRGRPTASGAPYDPADFTCAHRSFPIGTRVRVTELARGRSVVVTVNDRGPFVRGRVVDLSRAAAAVLGIIGPGVARVRVERLRSRLGVVGCALILPDHIREGPSGGSLPEVGLRQSGHVPMRSSRTC